VESESRLAKKKKESMWDTGTKEGISPEKKNKRKGKTSKTNKNLFEDRETIL